MHPTERRPLPLARGLAAVTLGTAIVLLVPLIAMRFTTEVAWTAGDFLAAALLLGGTGSVYVLLARALPGRAQRRAAGVALAAALLLVWAELAVGIFH